MDVISDSWFSELRMDDPIFMIDQGEMMETFDEELAAALGDEFHHSVSSDSNNSHSSTLIQRSSSTTTLCASPAPATTEAPPTKHHKPNNYYMTSLNQTSSTPVILSFANSTIMAENARMNGEDDNQVREGMNPRVVQPTKKSSRRVRPPSQTYDHIIAERKRREQLSQLFVALSALVPGLKKMDKTSVLGDAIKYLKQLQMRVKKLEEQTSKQNMESVVLVRKSQLLVDKDGDEGEGSSDENPLGSCDNNVNSELPEIGASVCGKSILLRIHCERNKGVLVKILSEIENLNLTVTNTSVAIFGSLTLDITIIAEMEKEFCSSVNDVLRSLRSALRHNT